MRQKWEYCVITGVDANAGGFKPHYPVLTYFALNGIETIIDLGNGAKSSRPESWRNVSEAGYVAHIIARLGMESWEMAGVVSESHMQGTGSHCSYFRRRVSGAD